MSPPPPLSRAAGQSGIALHPQLLTATSSSRWREGTGFPRQTDKRRGSATPCPWPPHKEAATPPPPPPPCPPCRLRSFTIDTPCDTDGPAPGTPTAQDPPEHCQPAITSALLPPSAAKGREPSDTRSTHRRSCATAVLVYPGPTAACAASPGTSGLGPGGPPALRPLPRNGRNRLPALTRPPNLSGS